MMSFKQHVNENYKNFIGPVETRIQREKWIDRVWDIVQKSYAPIGGIQGSGFGSKKDMIEKIPFWKLYTKGDNLVAAAFYKDKGGRKSVAIATDGSDLGKKVVGDIFKASLGVSYGEKSGPSLAMMIKTVPWDVLQNFMLTPKQISKNSSVDVMTVAEFGVEQLNTKDKLTYDKFPQLRPFFYIRSLGGEMHLKAAMGTPNLGIMSK
jgi:hypothetical protein